MKRVIAFILIFFFASTFMNADSSAEPVLGIGAELDLYLALKVNAEYRLCRYLGLYGSAGICIAAPTQVSFNLLCVYHLFDFDSPFQLNLAAGFLQCAFDVIGPYLGVDESFTTPYVYFNPGIAASVAYLHDRSFSIGLRGGAMVMIGYDLNRWREPRILPHVAIEYLYFFSS